MLKSIARSWLALQCQMIPGVKAALVAPDPGRAGALTPTACWPDGRQADPQLAAAGVRALAAGNALVILAEPDGQSRGGRESVIVACPLMSDGEPRGVVSVEIDSVGEHAQRAVIQLLQWGSAWLDFLLRQETAEAAGRLAAVVEMTAATLDHASFQAAASSLVTRLSQAFQCERVSLGTLERGHARVAAVSHTATIDGRVNLVREIEAAMDEAVDGGASVAYPALADAHDLVSEAHERLARAQQDVAVYTVPLQNDGQTFGALTFERTQGSSFDEASTELCDAVAALVGPVLELKRLAERSALARLGASLSQAAAGLVGPHRLRTKLTFAAVVALAAVLGVARGEYRIGAPAMLEARAQQALVAPIDSYIETAHVRAGESVHAGDLLAELDADSLELEHRRWTSEREELVKQHRRAMAQLDGPSARILDAQIGKATARVELIEAQLARTRIVAPIDGIVVTGDLSQSLGAPVERGQVLFELAPVDSFRIALQVAESDVAAVAPGQRGKLALSAMPAERLPFVVERVIGIANAPDGSNAFRVEARLESAPSHLRPGMKGVAKLDAGRRALLWIWTHDVVERLRLWVWAHRP